MRRDQRTREREKIRSIDQGRIQLKPQNSRFNDFDEEDRRSFRRGNRGMEERATRFADYNINDLSSRGFQDEDRNYSGDLGHFGKGPKGWKRSDERIKEEVCEYLSDDPQIDASHIEVEVKDAVVYLRGEVDSRPTKRAAEYQVEHISGIQDIQNELKIKRHEDWPGTNTGSTERDLSPLS